MASRGSPWFNASSKLYRMSPESMKKNLFEEEFRCEVTNWMWKQVCRSDVLLPFVHHWNILWNSSSSSKTYFWNSSSSSKYHSSRYGFELMSFTVQFDEQESSTFEVSWNIFLACRSSCFPCLKSTSNNRVLVHFNIWEWNAEIQIASGRSSRTNGRITVTARIESMLALCVQKTVWCFSVLWSFQQTSRQHVWDAIHVSSEICANFVRIGKNL